MGTVSSFCMQFTTLYRNLILRTSVVRQYLTILVFVRVIFKNKCAFKFRVPCTHKQFSLVCEREVTREYA